MKYYRYMSFNEFEKLVNGEHLVSKNKCFSARTDSFGFCFLGEDSNGYDPYEALEFLFGIVTPDVLVELEAETLLTECYGIYTDPMCDFWGAMKITEYCIQEYNKTILAPSRVIYQPDLLGQAKWEPVDRQGLKLEKLRKDVAALERSIQELSDEIEKLKAQKESAEKSISLTVSCAGNASE